MVDESIVTSVIRYLHSIEGSGIAVRFGVIYGSQVTGTADEWSDIDLIVVSPQFDGQRSRQDVDVLWRVAARTDSRIEPLPCGERQWLEDHSSPIVEIARREGLQVLV